MLRHIQVAHVSTLIRPYHSLHMEEGQGTRLIVAIVTVQVKKKQENVLDVYLILSTMGTYIETHS